jgi:hypothetical protein
MKELSEYQLEVFKNSFACISTIIENGINLQFAIARLIVDNDNEIRALRNLQNTNAYRLDKVEKALNGIGIV